MNARKPALGIALWLLLVGTASATVPNLINYQGRLLNAMGQPLDTTVSMTFTIYDASSGWASVWSETQPAVAVNGGSFSVLVGAVNPVFDSVFRTDTRWLGVAVGGDPELVPRSPLVSVPYSYRAIHSDSAGSLQGKDTTAFARATHSHVITTSDITNGTVLFEDFAQNGATSDQVIKWNGTAWVPASVTPSTGGWSDDGSIVRLESASDNVGIGTAVPAEKLDVVGNLRVTGTAALGPNSVSSGIATFSAGESDTALGDWSAVGGGIRNIAEGDNSAIGGGEYNRTSASATTIAGGSFNRAEGSKSTIAGGKTNLTSGTGSFVGGGGTNRALGNYSVVAGGGGAIPEGNPADSNVASGNFSFIGSGRRNVASATNSVVVSGGSDTYPDGGNTAAGGHSFIGTGWNNKAMAVHSFIGTGTRNACSTGWYSVVISGNLNVATGRQSTIVNGTGNRSVGDYSLVGGGLNNYSLGELSVVGGGFGNIASGRGAVICGGAISYDRQNTDSNHAYGDISAIVCGTRNSSGDSGSFVGAGMDNQATGKFSVCTGGRNNKARGEYSVVSGGGGSNDADSNTAAGAYSAVAGGRGNVALGSNSIVGGGRNCIAVAGASVVGGGEGNVAEGHRSVICGGAYNNTSGIGTVVVGGQNNVANGINSLAAGGGAIVNHDGSFVWSDGSPNYTYFSSTAVNQFSARATGGVRFVSAIDGTGSPTAGVSLAAGGGSWSSISDRNAKDNLTPVNGEELLTKLAAIPVAMWNYKSQDPTIRHIGPMAQDFYSAFGVGEDDKHITTIDADGVALAAIQELKHQLDQKTLEVSDLRSQIAELREMIQVQVKRAK